MRPLRLLGFAFLALIYAIPLGQAGWELAKGESVQALEVIGPPSEPRLRKFETELHDASFVYRALSPWYQLGLTRVFGRGNEKIVIGDDGWLYYADDLAFVSRGRFLDLADEDGNTVLGGITAFRDALAAAGVELLFVPVPTKTQSDPGYLGRWTKGVETARNSEIPRFMAALEAERVEVVDVEAVLAGIRSEAGAHVPVFMPRDTHWTPDAMERVAAEVAHRVESLVGERLTQRHSWRGERAHVRSAGDMPALLTLPAGTQLFPDMELDVRRVLDAESGEPFQPSGDAEVLVLGDSFTGVFSMEKLGIGTAAGFAEQLALELGRPVDSIAIPGGSIIAARDALARRPAPLAGKKIVVWEVGVRELMGDVSRWREVDLSGTEGEAAPAAAADGPIRATARITEVSRVPDGFAYALCLVVHELEVTSVASGTLPDGPLWVAFTGMVDLERAEGNRLAVGQELSLTLEPIEEHYDLEETSWIDDVEAGLDIWWATSWE